MSTNFEEVGIEFKVNFLNIYCFIMFDTKQ